jgi:hypothetical protein
MAKKKKTVKSLPFTPTGTMVVLIDMKEVDGPFELRIDNDVDAVLDVLRTLLSHMGPTMPVDSYSAKEEKKLAKYVRGK